MKLTKEQLEWCEKQLPKGRGAWRVNSQGRVDVDVDVRIGSWAIGSEELSFPVPFGKIKGIFDCSNNQRLKTLEGAPEECVSFNCGSCPQLTTLEGGPTIVEEDYACNDCPELKNLIGAPASVACFDASRCKGLETLEGVPKVGNWFDLESCHRLRDLRWLPELNADATIWFPKPVTSEGYPNLPQEQLEVLIRFTEGEIDYPMMRKIMGRPGLQKASSLGLI
jgi:hypothetical protein